ncbi:MAG: hypothetical protein HOL31_02060 [Candidatus Scalindua sp.]|jgi:hypothetical protein|nr:hypothetical protein [Candidatus Scalindua sp.]MBT7349686.1 hypothetical protein [candidate division WWE3 bacterium]
MKNREINLTAAEKIEGKLHETNRVGRDDCECGRVFNGAAWSVVCDICKDVVDFSVNSTFVPPVENNCHYDDCTLCEYNGLCDLTREIKPLSDSTTCESEDCPDCRAFTTCTSFNIGG